MAYVTGDLIRVTFRQKYDEQQCLNVFYYKMLVGGITNTPATFGQVWWEYHRVVWSDLVSNQVFFDRVVVENLDGDLSYGEYMIPTAQDNGNQLGIPMAAFNAYGFQLNRTTRAVRNGGKRVVGVVEEAVANYGVLVSTYLTYAQDLGAKFAGDIMGGVIAMASPVIVGFPHAERPERVEVHIDTVTTRTIVTTQNSRKRGHGS